MQNLTVKLFLDFLQIGLFSIGGGYAVIPMIQERVVTVRHWLTIQEFTDIITISQMTPGPLAVNTSTFVGIRIAGGAGAVAATVGCILAGTVFSQMLYRFFQKYKKSDYIFEVLRGLKAASGGLMLSAAGTIFLIAFAGTSDFRTGGIRWNPVAAVLFLAAFWGIRKGKKNPILMLIMTGVLGAFIYRLPGIFY